MASSYRLTCLKTERANLFTVSYGNFMPMTIVGLNLLKYRNGGGMHVQISKRKIETRPVQYGQFLSPNLPEN